MQLGEFNSYLHSIIRTTMIIILESASISIAVVVIFYVVVIIDGKGDMALGTRLSGLFF